MYKTISVRLPEVVREELATYAKHEKLEQTSEAARKLLLVGLEDWRKKHALDLFMKHKVSFSKAAELAKVTVWEFADMVKEDGRPWITDLKMLEKDLAFARK